MRYIGRVAGREYHSPPTAAILCQLNLNNSSISSALSMSSDGAHPETTRDPPRDLESQRGHDSTKQRHTTARELLSRLTVKDGEVYEVQAEKNPGWYQRLLDAGVEENGIKPVPVEHRTSTRYLNLFTVFFTCLLCLLP